MQPWYDSSCHQALHHLHTTRRTHGAKAQQTVTARRQYRNTMRKARATYLANLESLRIDQPAAFWRLLKPPKQPLIVDPAALHAHYEALLANPSPSYCTE